MNMNQREEFRYMFAGLCMQGIIAAPLVEGQDPTIQPDRFAELAVKCADALIEELEKERGKK